MMQSVKHCVLYHQIDWCSVAPVVASVASNWISFEIDAMIISMKTPWRGGISGNIVGLIRKYRRITKGWCGGNAAELSEFDNLSIFKKTNTKLM